MRNLFFALLAANLAYLAWAHWIDVPKPPPVNEATAKLPRLKLAEQLPPAQRPPAGATATQKAAMNVPSACLSVGPFADLENSARAASILRQKGFDPKQRAEEGQMSEGYWVYVAGMKDEKDTDRALVALERVGIKDALVMPDTQGTDRRLSLGLYSDRARAEKRAESVRHSGLKAEVAEHRLPSTVYWVDLAPLPGMNTVPLQDLFAEGVGSKIAVQPCPAVARPLPPTGTATVAPAPAAREAETASSTSAPPAAARKLP